MNTTLSSIIKKLFSALYFIALYFGANAQIITPQNHKTGAIFLADTDYAKLPLPNWDTLQKYSPNKNSSGIIVFSGTNGITMLSNPPVGDQGLEGSCVGWAVGYTALGILTYPKYNCWDVARRSPNYVFNQIKLNGNCTSGSFITEALNLVQIQGDCSWNLMPYVDGDCFTQPNTTQRNEAAQNKALN